MDVRSSDPYPRVRVRAVDVLVEGRVQGVGYRNFAQRRAQDWKLTGYALNLADGRVKVHAEGRLEAIDGFVKELGAGPPLARVERVSVVGVPFTGRYREFGVRFSEGR